jgi:hypothetical protein
VPVVPRTMTGGPLRRLQELAAELPGSPATFASDEGGESGGAACQSASGFRLACVGCKRAI